MTTPTILRCPDNHYRRCIFQLGPFIADYPEQVVLAGIVQGWCPKYVDPLPSSPVLRCAYYQSSDALPVQPS